MAFTTSRISTLRGRPRWHGLHSKGDSISHSLSLKSLAKPSSSRPCCGRVISVQDIMSSLESRKSEGITKDWNHLILFRPASEELRACAASRRIGASARGPSFEARREERRASQDDGGVYPWWHGA